MTKKPDWVDVLEVEGMSSLANRSILNQAVAGTRNARILEVGSWKGASAVSMCFGNSVECIHMVDNHSEFGDTRDALQSTCRRFELPAVIHDLDWFAPLPDGAFGGIKFDVYCYDGPHDQWHHSSELAIAWPHLADSFVYIVDDFCFGKVRRGFEEGIAALGGRVNVFSHTVYPSFVLNDKSGYWNGLLVAWCEKL